MLSWLIALLLVALFPLVPAVCPAAPLPAVVTVGVVRAAPRRPSMHAGFEVAAKFSRDTARNSLAEDEGCRGHAEGAECGDGGAVTAAGLAAAVPDSRAARGVAAAGADSLTVMRKP